MPTQFFSAARAFVWASIFAALGVLLCSCADGRDDSGPSANGPSASASGPSAKELKAIANTHYKATPGQPRECLGRLVFDVAENVEVAVSPDHTDYVFGMSTRGWWVGKKSVEAAGVIISINGPLPKTELDEVMRYHKLGIKNQISKRQKKLTRKRERIKTILAIEQQADHSSNQNPEGIPSTLGNHRAAVLELEETLKKLKASLSYNGFDVGLPDSRGWRDTAYLWRDQRLYTITLNLYQDERSEAQRQAALITAANNFRTRELFEIPEDIGICFPYGFIKDNGTQEFYVRSLFRYKDRPGVKFTFLTETVGHMGPEPTVFNAAARAIPKGSVFREQEEKIDRRVGPHSVKMGPLAAQQGGFSAKLKGAQGPIETYDVYTGYAGYAGSQVLPTIVVNMESTTQKDEPALKSDPPPFDESYGRLNALLHSINLRPTTQAMPELR